MSRIANAKPSANVSTKRLRRVTDVATSLTDKIDIIQPERL